MNDLDRIHRKNVTFNGIDFDFFYFTEGDFAADEVIKWCIRNIEKNDSFIEVGAHIGYVSTIVEKIINPKTAVYIEPHPPSFDVLKRNLEKNTDGSSFLLQRIILDKEEKREFFESLENPISSSIYQRSPLWTKKFIIESTTIDKIVERYKIKAPIVLKIDAEFAEPLIWKGLKNTLPFIKTIFMEIGSPNFEGWTGMTPEEFISDIRESGFKESWSDKDNIILTSL